MPLPAKYVSLSSRRASPESAPAVDDSTRVAKSYVPCVPWWHMLGDRTEKCSMCKIIGMGVPCLCVPVAMPLLSAHNAWRVLGCRFQAAHSEEVPDWAAPGSRTSNDNISPDSPPSLIIAPLLLERLPSTARQVAVSTSAERQSLHLRPGAYPQLPVSPVHDRFLIINSRTRTEPHDYVRPVIGCSSVLACLPQLPSVRGAPGSSRAYPCSQLCEECEAI